MGKVLKIIVGIALIATGLGAFGAAGMLGATAFKIGLTAVTWATVAGVVGLSLLGSALAPDMSFDAFSSTENYSGVKLQTHKSNTLPVPIVYGHHRLGGNVIYQETNNYAATNNADQGYNRSYWAVIAVAGHEIEGVVKMLAGSLDMVLDTTPGLTNQYILPANEGIYAKVIFHNAIPTDINLQDLLFPVHPSSSSSSAGTRQTGGAIGLADVMLPKNTVYLAIRQIYNLHLQVNIQLRNIQVEIEGKKIRTLTDVNTISIAETYSTNPPEILLDLLGTILNVKDEDIDVESFYLAKVECDNRNWGCNIAFVQQTNAVSAIQSVLATFRGSLVHSSGKWKVVVDTKQQVSVRTITDDDILNGTLNISMPSTSDIGNRIVVKYINPNDGWLSAEVVVEDLILQGTDSMVIEKVLSIGNVTNANQAKQLAEITLNSMRYVEDEQGNRLRQTPLIAEFASTVKNAELEVGDLITIDHDLLNRLRKFVVISTETDQSGLVQISSREYAETHYKDTNGNYII